MVTCSINNEARPERRRRAGALLAMAGALALLTACESRLRDDPHFGEAVRQNRAVQIADPDAHYVGVPTPGSNGQRVDAAQERYVRGQVVPPPSAQTSTVGVSGGGGGQGGSTPPSSGQ